MSDPAARTGRAPVRRRAALIAALGVVGAALVALSSVLSWYTAEYRDELTGTLTRTANGVDVVPELIPIALVTIAGLGATVATRATARRIVGGFLVIAGAWLTFRCTWALFDAPATLGDDLTRPVTVVADPVPTVLGPLIGLVGALLICVAGVLITLGFANGRATGRAEADHTTRAGTGPRPETSGRPRRTPRDVGDTTDDWWKALDEGTDPTASAGEPGSPVSDGPGPGGPAVSARPDISERADVGDGPGHGDDGVSETRSSGR